MFLVDKEKYFEGVSSKMSSNLMPAMVDQESKENGLSKIFDKE